MSAASVTAALPLLGPRDLAAPIAWRAGRPLSGAQFLAQAQALAARLPAQGRAVNLCQDRLHFALGLAAALLRGHTSLLPPNALVETLTHLASLGERVAGAGEPYALIDDPGIVPALQRARLPHQTVDSAALGPQDEAAVALLARPDAVPLVPAELDAVCLLTSGSTGPPQPHAKRWGQLVPNIGAEAERLAELLGRPDLRGLTLAATVPAQHSYGLESTVLLAMLGGAAFDAGRPYYPADIADDLARLPEPRGLVTTPFHLKTLLLAGVALPRTALLLSATAPLSPQLAAQAEAALDGRLIEIYGCTEAGQVAARRTTEGDTWTTLGALRLWREDLPAEAGQPGAGPDGERFMVLGGHVLEPTPLADVLVLQDERRFRLLGRANDLIHVAGKRSSLAHLNFHLNRVPGVADGAFWMPQDQADGITRTVAFVVAPGLSAKAVVEGLRAHVDPVFLPRKVVFVDSLPREATGKLTAQTLARFAREQLGDGTAPAATAPATITPSATAPATTAPATAAPAAVTPGPVERTLHIAADHPALAGHFPGRPVVPGVVLLGLVQAAIAEALAADPALCPALARTADGGTAPQQIEQVKFLAPVLPGPAGATLALALQPQGRGLAFTLREGAVVVARGVWGGMRA